jgi:hypothetical protein
MKLPGRHCSKLIYMASQVTNMQQLCVRSCSINTCFVFLPLLRSSYPIIKQRTQAHINGKEDKASQQNKMTRTYIFTYNCTNWCCLCNIALFLNIAFAKTSRFFYKYKMMNRPIVLLYFLFTLYIQDGWTRFRKISRKCGLAG